MQTHNPKVIDNDKDEVTVSLDGVELRGWSYKDSAEHHTKMLCAREYVEGWFDSKNYNVVPLSDEIDAIERERDMWKARAMAMLWRLPDDVTIAEIKADAEKAITFLAEQRDQNNENTKRS